MSLSIQPSPAPGRGIPLGTPHSVVNSLPEWQDNVSLATGRSDLVGELETTYPRFYIHPFILELTAIIVQTSDIAAGRNCLLFATRMFADECRSYINTQVPSSSVNIQCVTEIANPPPPYNVFAVFFSAELGHVMKFHMFSGCGLSTRLAEHCLLRHAGDTRPTLSLPSGADHPFSAYYQKHLPFASVDDAKNVIRWRFSGVIEGGGNLRGVPGASPNDVYLLVSGMQAVWRSFRLLAGTIGSRSGMEVAKIAHVNLLYTDSYKFTDVVNNGYHFFTDETLDDLEALLASGTEERPAILGLYTDFPGNPHLRSADLHRLRALADRYNFPIITDETVGGYLNVQTLPFSDVVVSSLTKLFSGHANVLGGALMLNPASQFYEEFKAHMEATYEDSYFDSDALVMEMNSREFVQRTAVVNRNAEALADMLYARSVMGGAQNSILQAVHYPKYRTRETYDRFRNPLAAKAGLATTGFGGLLSVTFTSLDAAKRFYSALKCYKGPTVGTVFTLATAFTAIAVPPDNVQWAEDHGVEESLRRCVLVLG
ncbi:pyridoxal phosphate-dependent transferase [Mycena sp. CBHHK59/15]|nr:pyridoxal phosphate-dependent transferase [Mycena sp. CBHHK59/15]